MFEGTMAVLDLVATALILIAGNDVLLPRLVHRKIQIKIIDV